MINGDGLKNNFKYLLISESSRQASKSYHRIMVGNMKFSRRTKTLIRLLGKAEEKYHN